MWFMTVLFKTRSVLSLSSVWDCLHTMRTSLLLCLLPSFVFAASPYPEKTPATPGNKLLDRYFAEQTREIAATNGVGHIESADDWKAKAPEYRRQMAEMLGLDPLPEKTPLRPFFVPSLYVSLQRNAIPVVTRVCFENCDSNRVTRCI